MFEKGQEKECLCGIKCNVDNCIHNNHQCGCTASRIEVGPTYAATVGDTVCRSFQDQKKTF